ncbi:MAG TPA: porphobilinogen synthase [Steroidobacteraceae bacterium]|jgi:porphobilinogen synthase|nr:porphobilinogen synthase [Steroidobacteraceae bacterium]
MSSPSSLSLRRLRQSEHIRALTREVHVRPEQLIQPLFVAEGSTRPVPVPGLTGVHQDTADSLLRQVEADLAAGVRSFLLFGVPQARSEHHIDWSYTAGQIEALKRRFGADLWLAVDVCLCSSTPHGHCGVLSAEGDHVDNDATLPELAQAAVAYAQAGADCVAPSDMMDGRIGAIRRALDEAHLPRTVLMSYAAKFHSTFYGPFRVAAESTPRAGGLKDRSTYQLDPARPGDAWLCAERDAAEGADILMVKPGLPYLDLLRELSQAIRKPWAVYHVSGEFAALEALAAQGLANRAAMHREVLTAFRRAGASMIITYGARYAREWLGA